MKTQGIYCIEHVASGKKYYGSSMNIKRRFSLHRNALKRGIHHNIYLQRAVNKYGIEAFIFYVVEETNFGTVTELQLLEKEYVTDNVHGYNIGSVGGGDNLTKHPDKEDIIRRRTATMTKNLSVMTETERKIKYGKPGDRNPRWIDGRSTVNLKKLCPVCSQREIGTKAKSCNKCNKIGKNNPFFGKKHSEETKKKLKKHSPWTTNATPEQQSYTKCYEITYPDSTTRIVYGMKAIALEFKVSIANVHVTIERMARDSLPTKRSAFYGHMIRIIDRK